MEWNGMEMEQTRPVVEEPVADVSVHKEWELMGWGFMKNGALTARTEMRNCLFSPVGGGKK